MSDDILNKTLRTLLHSSTDEGTRANALSALIRMIGDKEPTLTLRGKDEDDELTVLRRKNAQMQLAQIQLTDRLDSVENALRRLSNGLKSLDFVESFNGGAAGNEADQAFQFNAKQWVIDQVHAHGSSGVSKKTLQAMVSLQNNKDSITKRWSEVQNEGYCFLINPAHGEQVLASTEYSGMYPEQWRTHELKHDLKIRRGKTKILNIADFIEHETVIVTSKARKESAK